MTFSASTLSPNNRYVVWSQPNAIEKFEMYEKVKTEVSASRQKLTTKAGLNATSFTFTIRLMANPKNSKVKDTDLKEGAMLKKIRYSSTAIYAAGPIPQERLKATNEFNLKQNL